LLEADFWLSAAVGQIVGAELEKLLREAISKARTNLSTDITNFNPMDHMQYFPPGLINMLLRSVSSTSMDSAECYKKGMRVISILLTLANTHTRSYNTYQKMVGEVRVLLLLLLLCAYCCCCILTHAAESDASFFTCIVSCVSAFGLWRRSL
jgi:hypothetical protein